MTRGGATGIATVGLIVGSVWWLGHVPYRPERLLNPFPAQVTFVSSHANLAGRWEGLQKNRVTERLLSSLLGEGGELEALSADPDFQENLKRFGSDELVAGFVPEVGPARADTWYFTSWLGGRSHWLRWILMLSSGDMVRQDLPSGRMYWVVDTDLEDARGREMRFALMFEEGTAIGCLSADPHNIQLAVQCHDGMHPSILDRDEDVSSWVLGSAGADRGWVAPRPGGEGLVPAEYAVTAVDAERVTATIRLEGAWRTVGDESAVSARSPWRSPAYATAAASGEVSTALVAALPAAVWETDVLELMGDLGGSGCAFGLFGGEFGGRLRGIRVPAVALAIPCENEEVALVVMNRWIHRVGIREELGLLTQEVPGSDPTIYSISSVGRSMYSVLPEGERAAFAAVDGWLVAATNLKTLERLLAQRDWAGATAPPDGGPLWLDVDLARGGKSVRNALAAYSLVRMIQGGVDSENDVERLNALRAWIEQASDLGFVRARTRTNDEAMMIDIEVGP